MDNYNILIVEDEAITAMELQSKLTKFGYSVPCVTATGEEAIELADKLRPHLVLMDIMLAGEIDGTEAAKHITSKYHIPVVFLTAYNDDETVGRAKLSTPYGYLKKPFEIDEVKVTVELALHKHEMEQAYLAETMRVKNEFIRNMSHEFRSPLNGINGFIELLKNRQIDPASPELLDLAEDAYNNSNRLIKLVNIILNLAEIESGKAHLNPEIVDLNILINDAVMPMIKSDKNIQIKITVDPTLKKCMLDPAKFKDIVYEYAANAVKFSPPNAIVEISAVPETANTFKLQVKDHGIGITEEDLQKLFQPFKQLDMSLAKKFPGAGLGLALVKLTVEAQGGQVGVESTPGKGSTFYAILPRQVQPPMKMNIIN